MGFSDSAPTSTLPHVHSAAAQQGGVLSQRMLASGGGSATFNNINEFVILQGPYDRTSLWGYSSNVEANTQSLISQVDMVVTRCSCRVTANTSAVAGGVAFRDDGVDALDIVIGAGLTGIFTNATDFTVAGNSLCNWRPHVDVGGTITVKQIECMVRLAQD